TMDFTFLKQRPDSMSISQGPTILRFPSGSEASQRTTKVCSSGSTTGSYSSTSAVPAIINCKENTDGVRPAVKRPTTSRFDPRVSTTVQTESSSPSAVV